MDTRIRAGRWREALESFDAMAADGLVAARGVVRYTAAIAACGKLGQWARAQALYQEMHGLGLRPSEMTTSSLIQALVDGGQTDLACAVWREATADAVGHFPNVRQMLPGTLDLHKCSVAVACTALRCLLDDLRAPATRTVPATDVVIITGKGRGVLMSATREFLLDNGGPRVTDDPQNAGRFMLKRTDIVEWQADSLNLFTDD